MLQMKIVYDPKTKLYAFDYRTEPGLYITQTYFAVLDRAKGRAIIITLEQLEAALEPKAVSALMQEMVVTNQYMSKLHHIVGLEKADAQSNAG